MGNGFVVALQHVWGRSRGHEAGEEEGTRELGTWESGRSDGLHEVEEVRRLGRGWGDDGCSASGISFDGPWTVRLVPLGACRANQSPTSVTLSVLAFKRRSQHVETTSPMTTLPARKGTQAFDGSLGP